MTTLYSIRIRTRDKNLDLVTAIPDLSALCGILEESNDVVAYSVFDGGFYISSLVFGVGLMPKWKEKLYPEAAPKAELPKLSLAEEVILDGSGPAIKDANWLLSHETFDNKG